MEWQNRRRVRLSGGTGLYRDIPCRSCRGGYCRIVEYRPLFHLRRLLFPAGGHGFPVCLRVHGLEKIAPGIHCGGDRLDRRRWDRLCGAVQGVADHVVDGGEDRPFCRELDHRLGGMDVDVHLMQRQVDMEDAAGEFTLQEPVGVGGFQGGGEHLGTDDPSAAEEGLHSAGSTARQGLGDETVDRDALPAAVHRREAQREVTASDGVDGRQKLTVAGGMQLLLTVADETDGDVRTAEGNLL